MVSLIAKKQCTYLDGSMHCRPLKVSNVNRACIPSGYTCSMPFALFILLPGRAAHCTRILYLDIWLYPDKATHYEHTGSRPIHSFNLTIRTPVHRNVYIDQLRAISSQADVWYALVTLFTVQSYENRISFSRTSLPRSRRPSVTPFYLHPCF